MTRGAGVPTLVQLMFTEDQLQYFTEVLGVTCLPSAQAEVVVLTSPLSEDNRILLSKILASIKLTQFAHIELANIELGQLPEGQQAKHVFAFTTAQPGKAIYPSGTWWVLPSVESMAGTDPEVASQKKIAWSYLQQFNKEQAM